MSIRNWIKELQLDLKELQLDWKYGYDPAQRAYKTRQELPEGDPIREAAQKRCAQEYKASFAQEDAFSRKYGYSSFTTLENAANFANELCKAVGTKPIKEVCLCEPGYESAGAYYKRHKRSIYVRLPVSTIIMVHETSHHIVDTKHFIPLLEPHGEEFLEAEQKLFDYLLNH